MKTNQNENGQWLIDSTYQPAQTLFYSGVLSSQTQLVRYVGQGGFIASTGESVAYKQGLPELAQALDVIYAPFIGHEIADVNLTPFSSWRACISPITWGFVAKSCLTHWWYGVEITKTAVPNAIHQTNASVAYHSIHLDKLSIAQKTDIDSHQLKYEAWQASEDKSQKLIAYGVSRGAATTLVSCATNNYEGIKLIILEGCFLSVEDTLEKRFGAFSFFARRALQMVTAYREDGVSPIDCLNNVPEGIPIAFISSLVDKEVPYQSVWQLAQALANSNKNQVYFLTLQESRHPTYMHDDLADRYKYQQFMHALYKKYHLAHKPLLAEKGKALLDSCLLSADSYSPPYECFYHL